MINASKVPTFSLFSVSLFDLIDSKKIVLEFSVSLVLTAECTIVK
jgi:hypothetical protein